MGRDRKSEDLVRGKVDKFQQRERVSVALIVGCLAISLYGAVHSTLDDGRGGLFPPAMFAFGVLLFALYVCLGRFWLPRIRKLTDDELFNAARARSLKVAYPIVVAALGATYVATVYRPSLSQVVLPVLMFVAVALPAVVFFVLTGPERNGDA